MEQKEFFRSEHIKEAIKHAISKLTNYSGQSIIADRTIDQLVPTLRMILNNGPTFDEHCPINIEWIGSNMLSLLSNISLPSEPAESSQLSKFETDCLNLYALIYRFIKEFQFSISGELSIELNRFVNFGTDNFSDFPEDARQTITYANYVMPAQIIKQMLHSAEIKSFLDFKKNSESARQMKTRWDKEIQEKSQIIDEFSTKLTNLTTEYNFVGIAHGFKDIYKDKIKERNIARALLICLGFATLIPPVTQAFIFYFKHDLFFSRINEIIYIAPTLLAIEILLVYFFRISLQNLNSIRLQLLQLKLRMTLCQFIQSYADYSIDIKKADSAALEKFESVIFSQIAPDEELLPSTFDGIDQIGKLIQTIKGR